MHRCPLSQALSSEKVQGEGRHPEEAGTPVGFLRPPLSAGFSWMLPWWQRTRLCAALRMKIWSGAWLSGGAGARRSLTFSTSLTRSWAGWRRACGRGGDSCRASVPWPQPAWARSLTPLPVARSPLRTRRAGWVVLRTTCC